MFAAGFPLFGVQMYERLGFQWATRYVKIWEFQLSVC